MRKSHLVIPAEETGYVLNVKHSYFSVVIPEDTVNLVSNPEVADTIGYTGLSATIASNGTHQKRGARSILVTPSAPGGGIYYSLTAPLPVNRHYTFSVDIFGAGRYAISFGDNAGARVGPETTFVTPNFWNRYSVTIFTMDDSSAQSLVVRSLDGAAFYVDGFQCEQKPYATTFCSGNIEAQMDTSAPGRLAYGWMGVAHRSSSFRTRFVLDAGRPIPMHELGFDVTDFSGFGYAVPELFQQRLAMRADWVYQGASLAEKQMTIGGYFSSPDLVNLMRKRGQLGAGIYGTEGTISPILLHVQFYDDTTPVSELAEIECIYAGGMEGVITNLYQEKCAITFRCIRPFLRIDGNVAATLDTNKLAADSPISIMYPDGTMEAAPSGAYSWSDDQLPYRMAIAKDGSMYVTRGNELLRYSRAGWAQADSIPNALIRDCCTGPDGKIYYIYEDDEDGSQYGHMRRYNPATGLVELNTGDDAVEFHTSFGGTNIIMSRVRADPYNNRVYVTGNYGGMEVGGSAPAETGTRGFDGVAYLDLNTNTWMGFPVLSADNTRNYCVYDVAPGNGDALLVVGDFMTAGYPIGSTGPWSWALWNPYASGAWNYGHMVLFRHSRNLSEHTAGQLVPADLKARTCIYDRRRSLYYVGGAFDIWCSGNPTDSTPGAWTQWMTGDGICSIDIYGTVRRLGFGLADTVNEETAYVNDLALSPDGKYLYVAGMFNEGLTTTSSSPSYPDPGTISHYPAYGFAVWDIDLGVWAPSDIVMPSAGTLPYYGSSVVVATGVNLTNAYDSVPIPDYTEWYGDLSSESIVSNANAIYVSHTDESPTYKSPVTVVTVPQGARVVPRLEVRGPADIHKIINATTGHVMSPTMSVNAGESIVFSFYPGPVWIRSTVREVEYANLGKDSWPDLGLITGKNNIVLDIDIGTGGAASLYWKEEYAAIEALVVRNG